MAEVQSTCRFCGVLFTSPKGRAFCTPSHRAQQWAADNPERVAARYAAKPHPRRDGVEVECRHCGAAYEAKRADAKYCSRSCSSAATRAENGDAIRERAARWARENPESSARWREANPELVRRTKRAWYYRTRARDPERFRAQDIRSAQIRRAREAAVPCVDFSQEQLLARYAFFGDRCWMCGRGDVPLHMDHVKPISRGGAHMLSNIRPACKPCNSGKKNKWSGPVGVALMAG